MPHKKHVEPIVDHRAPDADAALEQTFEDGKALDVLPPEDRREPIPEPPAAAVVEGVVVEAPAPVVRTPYTGQRYRIHDPERPGMLLWADESGEPLPEG